MIGATTVHHACKPDQPPAGPDRTERGGTTDPNCCRTKGEGWAKIFSSQRERDQPNPGDLAGSVRLGSQATINRERNEYVYRFRILVVFCRCCFRVDAFPKSGPSMGTEWWLKSPEGETIITTGNRNPPTAPRALAEAGNEGSGRSGKKRKLPFGLGRPEAKIRFRRNNGKTK
uniref:Uncharacterized protein n=1 Tax=Anopheles minimus TaxID=112268 RepID=A0A182VSC3_9DIPT